ncbi:MAG: EF-P beta-lysylation protein EpmB [Gammaproteobacteria bacterium]|nr:EF-P beta-lysylation protein EpmB [Gammaproteobacteria bacterium]
MIHRNKQTLQMPSWQNQLSDAIKSPEALIKALNLPISLLPEIEKAHQLFPIRVPLSFISKMEKGNINDPLLKQVIPTSDELIKHANYTKDPVGDAAAEKTPGLLHKYFGRVLLTVTGACGIHCRYCFRRHFDYSASNPGKQNWLDCLEYIRNDESIFEVILSGGDPLSLSDQKLAQLVKQIAEIPHVRFLRIHTRQIVVLPDRVNDELLQWISNSRLKCIFVIHCNHPAEIAEDTTRALNKLQSVGVELFNQSVLLRGINDSCHTLEQLSLTLFESGVKPYYLHLLDKVEGASHFDTPEYMAREILDQLQQRLPGYLVPKLVREIAGIPYKSPVSS